MKVLSKATILASLLAAAGCGGADVEAPRPVPGPPGSIAGAIRFAQDLPLPGVDRLLMDQNADVCGVTKPGVSFLVSPDTRGIRNVVLSVDDVADPAPPPSGAFNPVITQTTCMFEPHVQVIPVGAALRIRNEDPILHNMHTYLEPSKATIFNIGQPVQGQVNEVLIEDEGLISVRCDVHRWMSAFIVAKPHPYWAISAEDGTYRIDNVPPGPHTVSIWHEELGSIEREVTVVSGQVAALDLEIGD